MKRTAKKSEPCSCRYALEVWQHADLAGDWAGWRLRGRHLVSPDGDRISPARLRGLLFQEAVRARLVTRRKVRQGAARPTPIDSRALQLPAKGVTRSALP